MTDIEELSHFLGRDANPNIRKVAVDKLLDLTVSDDVIESLATSYAVLSSLKHLCSQPHCQLAAYRCLINISGTEARASHVLTAPGTCVVSLCVADVLRGAEGCVSGAEVDVQQVACALLANISRDAANCRMVVDRVSADTVRRLVVAFCQTERGWSVAQLDRLAHVLANFSQTTDGRRYLMGDSQALLRMLLPVVHCESVGERRRGIVGVFRNCSMQTDCHEWLLGVDVIPHLLLPLAGPESFDEEDMQKLPIDLQYLDEEKQREPDLEIRRMLLEAMLQLCSTSLGRVAMRKSGAYLILREYHKWETDPPNVLICEDLVNVILKTEEEIGVDDLKSLDTSTI